MTPPKGLYWGAGTAVPGEYARRRGVRRSTPGWEDVDLKRLAAGTGVHYRFLLNVLSGKRNCTLAFLLRVARHLSISPGNLVNRIEEAWNISSREPATVKLAALAGGKAPTPQPPTKLARRPRPTTQEL